MVNVTQIAVREAVADSIRYRRYCGADLAAIETDVGCSDDEFKLQCQAALSHLESSSYAEKRGSLWFLHPSAFKAAKGDSHPPEFHELDFFIALAISFAIKWCDGPCELTSLMRSIEGLARAAVNFDEVYGGLNRLIAGGLATQKRNRYSTTSKSDELFALAKANSKQGPWHQIAAFQRLVMCPCCGVTLKRVNWRVKLLESAFYTAVAEQHSDGIPN
jgi:hypothetical protein